MYKIILISVFGNNEKNVFSFKNIIFLHLCNEYLFTRGFSIVLLFLIFKVFKPQFGHIWQGNKYAFHTILYQNSLSFSMVSSIG